VTLSRRDDLESLMYVLIYLGKGAKGLPWSDYNIAKLVRMRMLDNDISDINDYIKEMKKTCPLDQLCMGLPRQFPVVLSYIRSLHFIERPDYDWIRDQFVQAFEENEFRNDNIYDWNFRFGEVDVVMGEARFQK
jgi:hypothetical protein